MERRRFWKTASHKQRHWAWWTLFRFWKPIPRYVTYFTLSMGVCQTLISIIPFQCELTSAPPPQTHCKYSRYSEGRYCTLWYIRSGDLPTTPLQECSTTCSLEMEAVSSTSLSSSRHCSLARKNWRKLIPVHPLLVLQYGSELLP